jgi:altronate hydrolase
MSRIQYLQIQEQDNVLVALTDLTKGSIIQFQQNKIVLKENIPAKHKIFINDMQVGDEVYMYGVVVGKLTEAVQSGMLMTTNNTVHAAEPYAYKAVDYHWKAPDVSAFKDKTFMGYHRADGKVGTANYWLFIPTVFCENRNLDVIKEALHHSLGYAVTGKYLQYAKLLAQSIEKKEDIHNIDFHTSDSITKRVFPNIDGIKFLNHQGGCGGTRQDANTLSKLLAAYADHPNVAGITLLSLGCQHLQMAQLKEDIKLRNPHFNKPIFAFEQQQSKTEESLIKEAILQTFTGLVEANQIKRAPAPLSKLVLGVKCGGSDGFSGISANPAVGVTADLLVALGGTVLLAEFPELCGAEQDLIDRCVSAAIAQKFIHLMQTYDAQAHAVGSGFHMNPSPGNIKDGLITDAIKSTGAAKKGGYSPVTDVLDYTEPATKPGLNLVCTPGNDVEATTGKAAAGATLILFTTGLGTPTGNPVSPVIKVATNSQLANRMSDIIDIDTGGIISGEKTVQDMGAEILEYCINAASGRTIPKAVQLGQDDFIPWKRGVSL